MLEIEGVIKNIIFRNEENSYTVAIFETEDGEITAVGPLSRAEIGLNYQLKGDIVYHPKYGEQFQIESALFVMPKTKEAIEAYLSSGLLPHIGKLTAKRIVEKWGDEALEIMENNPDRLEEIKGLGKVKIAAITKAIVSHKSSRESIIYLASLGFSTNAATRIYRFYGDSTIARVKENPYQLIDDIPGIGFKLADRTALKGGLARDSKERIQAGIDYILEDAARQQGHSYLEVDHLLNKLVDLLRLDKSRIAGVLEEGIIEGKLVQKKFEERTVIYHERLFLAEDLASTRLVQIYKEDLPFDIDIDDSLEDTFLDQLQRQAIKEALTNKITVITGGPGTGKTTIIRAMVDLADKEGLKYKLAAPTGRAAKRMEEATSREASTIHRMLGYYISEEGYKDFEYNSDKPLEADIIIIDEASMIDIELLASFVDAITAQTCLVFVGDIDQLPSVGPGNVLKDIISSGFARLVSLKKIYRQEEGSSIVENAHRINRGYMPVVNDGRDFYFIEARDDKATQDLVLDLVSNRLAKHYQLDPIRDIQVLSLMKKGRLGTEELNIKLQARLNPKKNKDFIEYSDKVYRTGDKVMQKVNNYDLSYKDKYGESGEGIYNGDTGIISNIDPDAGRIYVSFDDGSIASYDSESIAQLMHSYAITIHKSQGSEFPVVVMPVFKGPYLLLTRNLIYTAVTRAKKLVVLVGSIEALRTMVDNDKITRRNSSLDLFMKEKYDLFKGVI